MRLMMPIKTAKSLASLINIAIKIPSKDKDSSVKQILNQVQCYYKGNGVLVAIASDRIMAIQGKYVVSEGIETTNTTESSDIISFNLTRQLADFIKSYQVKLGKEVLTLDFDFSDSNNGVKKATSIKATISGSDEVFDGEQILGAFPTQAASLIESWIPAKDSKPVALNFDLGKRLTLIVDSDGNKVNNWLLELGESNNSKPGMIRLSTNDFVALWMPLLHL